MTWTLPTTTRTPMAQALADLASGGTVDIYTGAKPAPDAAATGTLLATLALPTPAATVADGVITIDADPDIETAAVAGGTAGWGRIKTSGGATVADGEVGLAGSGKELIINSTTIEAGGAVKLLDGTLTMPAG